MRTKDEVLMGFLFKHASVKQNLRGVHWQPLTRRIQGSEYDTAIIYSENVGASVTRSRVEAAFTLLYFLFFPSIENVFCS